MKMTPDGRSSDSPTFQQPSHTDESIQWHTRLKEFPFLLLERVGVTAAGPYRVLTGFPYYAFAGTIKLCFKLLRLYVKYNCLCQVRK
jgi:hypothetical protein